MADPVQLSPPVLSGRTLPVEVPPARPAMSSADLAAPATADRLQFTRQTRTSFLQRYFQENVAGAPLDITTGLSSYDRFQLGLHRTEEDQRRYLEGRKYENIRKATDGQWIVRAQGDSGPVDLVADPLGVDAGDWAELGASAPEIIGSFAGLGAARLVPKLGQVKGFVGGARDVLTGAAGSAAAGAIKDIATRTLEGAPANLPQVGKDAAVTGAMDTLFGTAIGGGMFVARFRRNPWVKSRTDVQFDALRAQREIADKNGIFIPLTPAEMTSSPSLVKREAFVEQVPGGSTRFQAFRRKQQAALNLFQEVMFGSRVPDADVVGQQAIRALQMTTGATDATVDAARINLSKAALHEMEEAAATQSLSERSLGQIFTGDALRNRVFALKSEAKAVDDALFGRVRELGGDQPIFEGTGLADDAAALRKDLPRSFEGIPPTVPARAVSGAPTSVPFSTPGVLKILDELEAGRGHLYRLSELQQMRQSIYDDIGKGNALPGYNTHHLSRIGKALTKAIDDGVSKMPTSDLKDALVAANKHHIEQVLPFGRKGIAQMFVRDGEPGYRGSAQLAKDFAFGAEAADNWRTLKEFIGSDSLEGRTVKRMVFDHVIEGSMEPGSQLLNAKEVLRKLAALKDPKTGSPDLYNEVFGKAADDLQRVAKFAIAGEKDMLPAHEIVTILQSGKGPTVTALRALKEAEATQSTLYTNKILEGVRESGKWDTSKITPHEFVNRFAFNDKVSAGEIGEVMQRIETSGPGGADLVEDIRASALAKLFREHRGKGTGISDALTAAHRNKEMRTLLGDELFADLGRYGAMEKAILTNREKSMAGALAGGQRIDMLLTAPLNYLSDFWREKIQASVLTSSTMRKWAMRQPEPSEAVTMLMMASPEFLRGVFSSFGDDTEGFRQAETYLGSARRALSEAWARSEATPDPAAPAPKVFPMDTNAPPRLSPPTLFVR